jgi:TP901 family phage tail tape measure protein
MLATGEEIARLKDQILRNAGDLGQAPRKLAEVDMELAGQGFHEHQVETMMPVAAKLARAGLTDSKVSAEILGSTNRSFYGEDVSQSGKVGDIIARVHDLGGIQIPQLLETFKYAGPAYHALGQSLEDLGAITAILGRAGIKGSMAGTGTRTMLLRLAAPMVAGRKKLEHIGLGEELKKGQSSTVVKELGLHVEDDKGNMLPMVTIMKELVAKTKGMGNVRRAAIFKDMFGLETVTEALALANAAGERFDEVSHDVHNANGTLDRMYKIMSKGLIPAWDRFTAKLEVFASLVLERASPGLEGLLDGVGWLLDRGRDFILWLDEATDHGKRLHWAVVALKLAVVALLPFLVAAEIAALPGQLAAIGAVITGTVIPAIVSATRAVIGFIIANAPIAAVVAVFALLALVFEDIYTWATGGESALGGLWDSIAEEGGTVLYGLWKFFAQDLPAVFTGFINGVGPAMSGMWNGIGQLCQMAWEGIKSATGQAMDAVKAAFSGAFENVYNTVVGWIDKAIAKVHEVADAARRIIPGQGDDGGGTSPGGFGAGPLRSPGLPSWVLGAAGTPALAGVTPSADAAARAGGGGPVVPVSAHTEVHVNVGRDSSPSQTGHVVADHVEHAVRKAVHGAARVLPKQKR